MPAFPIQYSTPIGNLRTLTQSEEVAPRAAVATGVRTGRDNQLDLQAISAEATGAGEVSDIGTQFAQVGAELLKPFEKLRQSREIMAATDIATNAILDAQDAFDKVQRSGQPYTEWLPTIEKTVDTMFGQAVQRANEISPAAAVDVAHELQQERLRLFANAQKVVVNEDKETQLAQYQRFKGLQLRSYGEATDPQRRADIEDRLVSRILTLGQTNVISRDAAQIEQDKVRKELATTRVLERFDQGGLVDGMEYARTEKVLSIDEQREVINKGRDLIAERLTAGDREARQKEKQLKEQQSLESVDMHYRAGNPNATVQELEAVAKEARDKGLDKRLGETDANSVIALARAGIEKKARGLQEFHNPELMNDIIVSIYREPTEWTPAYIGGLHNSINSQGIQTMLALHRSLLNEQHFAKRPDFKNLMDLIASPFHESAFAIRLPGGSNEHQQIKALIAQEQTDFLFFAQDLARQMNPGNPDANVLDARTIKDVLLPLAEQKKAKIEKATLSSAFSTVPKKPGQ